jgi:hypothetical protein
MVMMGVASISQFGHNWNQFNESVFQPENAYKHFSYNYGVTIIRQVRMDTLQ